MNAESAGPAARPETRAIVASGGFSAPLVRRGPWLWRNAAILAAGLLLIGIIWISVATRARLDREATIAGAVDRNTNLAIAFEQYVVRTLNLADSVLQTTKREYARSGRQIDLPSLIADLVPGKEQFLAITLIDEHGQSVKTSITSDPVSINYADREHFRVHEPRDSGQVFVGKPARSLVLDKILVPITRRINKPDGSFGGVAVVQIEPRRFTEFYGEAKLRPGDLFSLTGLDGIIRARRAGDTETSGENIANGPLFRELVSHREGNFASPTSLDGIPRLFSFRTLQGYPLVVAAAQSEDDVLSGFRERQARVEQFAVAATVLIVVFTALLLMALGRNRRMHGTLTARKDSEEQLTKVARARRIISEYSRVLVHATEEGTFLRDVCAALVGPGGYRLAWVGMAENDAEKSIRPVAQAGVGEDYVHTLRGSWGEGERGRGTSGQAIRSGRTCVNGDIQGDPALAPWHDLARRHGFKSVASLPLSRDGVPFGVLVLDAPERDAFDSEEITLLEELAADTAYGIVALRSRAEHARSVADLRSSEERLRNYFDLGLIGISITSPTMGCLEVNDKLCSILGYDRDEMMRTSWITLTHPADREAGIAEFNRAIAGEIDGYTLQKRFIRKDGAIVDAISAVKCVRRDDGSVDYFLAQVEDITERKQAEEGFRESERRFSEMLANVQLVAIMLDTDARITYCNDYLVRLTGWKREEIIGQNWFDRFVPAHARQMQHVFPPNLSEGPSTWHHQNEILTRSGELRLIHWNDSVLRAPSGEVIGTASIGEDVTQRKAAEGRVEYLATHDALTDLPNRNLLNDRLDQAISHAQRTNTSLAIIFLDLDHFKYVNDGYGHPVGDALLKAIADRLRNLIRSGDTVARLGGDEFVILLTHLKEPLMGASAAAHTLSDSFSQPFTVAGRDFAVTCSMGISLYPMDGKDLDELLRNADAAMYRVKEMGRNDYQFYASEMSIKALERVTMETALRQALQLGQFEILYQPLVVIATGKPVGMEALIRWRHPVLGLIAPDRFIPLAEENGLIVPIGEWVLRTACAQNKTWQDAGLPPLTVAVNLSALQLRQPGFVALVRRVLDQTGLAPRYLNLELTESMVMGKTESVIGSLNQLRAMGIELSMDDFGTGYSNLGQLMHLPLNTLKIDRTFVRDLPAHQGAGSIARAIVSMGRSLGMRVVAEGVETKGQAEFLESVWCEHAQGYLYCRPLPVADFADWIRSRAPPAPALEPGAPQFLESSH